MEVQLTARTVVIKTIITHTVTYVIMGLFAYVVFDYPRLYSESELRHLMRPTNDPWVMAGPLFQPVRGLLFGIMFYVLRESIFRRKHGWLVMWMVLLVFGILGTFGPTPSSLEGVVYTALPLDLHLTGLPEILLQALLLSAVLFYWVNNPRKKAIRWIMGSAFLAALFLPALGLLFRK